MASTEFGMQEISASDIAYQLKCFEKGTNYVQLLRPATVGDGIFRLSEKERKLAITTFDEKAGSLELVKFVPASGAATRMFKRIYQWIGSPGEHRDQIEAFFERAEELAFFESWLQAADRADVETFASGLESKVRWLQLLVADQGVNYADKPKGLIPFHLYDNPVTPLEEHLHESVHYALGREGAKVHFTVSPEHEEAFNVMAAQARIAAAPGVPLHVSYSHQKKHTDTIAVTADNIPVEEGGRPVFRPGGHGALIHNLNELEADLVFIKNIDNVCHRRLLHETVEHKKVLAGTLLHLRQDLMALHEQVSKGLVDQVSIQVLRDKWRIRIPKDYKKLRQYLQRPIRVCGMVKNEGEPGGGPFWCLDKHTGESLQIVEQSQVDLSKSRQSMIAGSATHFNPVDIVCSLRDLEGQKIDLLKYVDEDLYFIAGKSIAGRDIKALEWPGLWNGGMAHWITVFVEVPVTTFNPVKEISDLLRPAHLGA